MTFSASFITAIYPAERRKIVKLESMLMNSIIFWSANMRTLIEMLNHIEGEASSEAVIHGTP